MLAGLEVQPTSEIDCPAVRALLREVLDPAGAAAAFREDVLRWKCYAPHPFWPGSRSYAARQGDGLVSHGCLMPEPWLTASGQTMATCVVDWAAKKSAPGAGMLIFREAEALVGTVFAVGGSDDTQRLLPVMGYAKRYSMRHYTRVVRPFAEFRSRGDRSWRAPVRLARDIAQLARGGTTSNWKTREVS